MPIIDYDIEFILNWLVNYLTYKLNRSVTFAILVRKTYVQVATLSVQTFTIKNSYFKRTVSWNKYQSSVLTKAQN